MQEEMETHEKQFVATLDGADSALDKASLDFRRMDAATSGLVAAATTTGMRLATAHKVPPLPAPAVGARARAPTLLAA